MNLEEFKKKWQSPPMYSEDYDQFVLDAESVGGIILYECSTPNCGMKTKDYATYKKHTKEMKHYITQTTVLEVGWK